MYTSITAWWGAALCLAIACGSLTPSSPVCMSATPPSSIARPRISSSAAACSAYASPKNPKRPIHVGLGTDIGAGTSFSLLQILNEAYKIAALNSAPINAFEALYLATLGGAEALGLEDRIGSLQVGREADIVVLNPKATPLLAFRESRLRSLEETLFVLMSLGDDRSVRATYVAGALAHAREPVDG